MATPVDSNPGAGPPKAAFVIPAYNAERTLAETVRSALAQTEQRIEVVIVDDGSRDGTFAVGTDQARMDDRVRVVKVENGGPARARNAGLRLVRAPYVVFLDADDLVPPVKVEVQSGLLDSEPDLAVAYSDECYLEPTDGGNWTPRPKDPLPPDACRALLTGEPFPMCIHSAMHRRSTLESIGGFREDRAFWGTDDYDLLIRIALAGGRFQYVPSPPVHYRILPGSISRDVFLINLGRLNILESLAMALAARGSEDCPGVRMRVRHICLSLAGMCVARGDRRAGRSFVLRAGRWGHRPGQIFEVVRYLAFPMELLRFGGVQDPKAPA